MKTVNVARLDGLTEASGKSDRMRFVVLGGTAPVISPENLQRDIGSPCSAIILLDHIEPPEFTDTLSRAPDPAVPIADFFGNHPLRRDFSGSNLDNESITELKQCVAPISRRLNEIPFRAERGGPHGDDDISSRLFARSAGQSHVRPRLSAHGAVPACRHRRPRHDSNWNCSPTWTCSAGAISLARTPAANAARRACMSMRPVPVRQRRPHRRTS